MGNIFKAVKDAFRRTLLQSGQVDDNGNIDSQARIFNIKLADKDGNHTANVVKADHVLSDNRIPPKGYAIENYILFVPLSGILGYTIEARLLYRSASQSLIDEFWVRIPLHFPLLKWLMKRQELPFLKIDFKNKLLWRF